MSRKIVSQTKHLFNAIFSIFYSPSKILMISINVFTVLITLINVFISGNMESIRYFLNTLQ